MRINVYLYGILALILFLGTVQVAQAAGYYNTSGKVSVKGEAIVLTTSSDPSSIKGWMTIGDVSKAFNIPIEKIVAEFKLPATVGRVQGVSGPVDLLGHPEFAAAIGLARFGAMRRPPPSRGGLRRLLGPWFR